MYEGFYNLSAEPFRLSPDHRFCYEHQGYAKARAYLTYAFSQAEGFVMITGRPGTGKTTLIGELVDSLADDTVTTAELVCTQLQADDLLRMVAHSFGLEQQQDDKGALLQRLAALLEQWYRAGRRALLIVDEAQDLSPQAMEELRLLTNIQADGKPLLQIFLLGQPELRDIIHTPAMEQLHQRIVAASHLEALKPDETEAYIKHRLASVGWMGDPAFSRAVFPLIHKFSEGVPRRINLICSRLFLHGSVEQKHALGVQDLKAVIQELHVEQLAAGTFISNEDFRVEDVFDDIETPARQISTMQPGAEAQPEPAEPVEPAEPAMVTPAETPATPTPGVRTPERAATQVPPHAASHSHGPEHSKWRGWLPLAIAFNLALLILLGIVFKPSDILPEQWLAALRDLQPLHETVTATPANIGPSAPLVQPVSTPAAEPIPPASTESLQEIEVTSTAFLLAPRLEQVTEPAAQPDAQRRALLVEFGFNSSDLSAEAQDQLSALAGSLTDSARSIYVTGYSDSRGDPTYNLRLSLQRANTVAAHLLASGIASDRLVVEGRGVYDESSAEHIEREQLGRIGSARFVQIVSEQ